MATDQTPLMSQGKEFGRMAGERQQQLSYIPQQQQTTNCINYNATAAQPSLMPLPSQPNSNLGIAVFVCLCCFFPTGLAAVVYGWQVNKRYDAGDYEGAQHASENSYRWSKISVIIGVMIVVVWVIASFASLINNTLQSHSI